MSRPPDLEKEQARGEIPRATRYDACVVRAPHGRFVFRGLVIELLDEMEHWFGGHIKQE